MKLQDNIDFTALNWVKHELDATLKQARDALEAYVDDPSNVGLMRESALPRVAGKRSSMQETVGIFRVACLV